MICEILGTADGINKKKSIDTRRFSVKDKKIIDPLKGNHFLSSPLQKV